MNYRLIEDGQFGNVDCDERLMGLDGDGILNEEILTVGRNEYRNQGCGVNVGRDLADDKSRFVIVPAMGIDPSVLEFLFQREAFDAVGSDSPDVQHVQHTCLVLKNIQ